MMRFSALVGRWGWLWLAWLLAASPAAAQPRPSGGFQLVRPGKRAVHFPFITQRNLIIVAVRLNGRGPYNFLLDTGVATSLLTDSALADSLGLTHGTTYRLTGVGGQDSGLTAYEAVGVRVELPGILAPRLSWLVLNSDVLDLSGYAGMPVKGILGSELFHSLVIAIQPQQNRIVAYDPAQFRAPRGHRWATLPLRLEQYKAYLTAQVEQLPASASAAPLPLKLLLDTGAGHALSLETTADPRLRLPATRLRTDLGRGLSGLVSGYLGRVASVRLGHYYLPQVLTSFPDSTQVHQRLSAGERSRQGNLGYEMLKRFSIIIDYPHERLLLRSAGALRAPFEYDMCGLDLLATGPNYRRYLVQRVVPDSPAATAGISSGEELMSVNFLPVSSLSITELSRLLRLQDGLQLFLVLRRPSGELHPASIRLKRRI
jgi:predicted aspartyl protease